MPGFGFGHGFSRRRSFLITDLVAGAEILYGPNYGPRGPKKVLISVWNQADQGYCRATNNLTENLYAVWASRGINCVKPSHYDQPLQGRGEQLLAAVKANNLMLISAPTWYQYLSPVANPGALDARALALNDPYWRTNWIAYSIPDETDLLPFPHATHVAYLEGFALDGVTKPVVANYTRRVASPGNSDSSATINWKTAFETPQISGLSQDSYQFHLAPTTANAATAFATSPQYHLSTFNLEGLNTLSAKGRRFTANYAGLSLHLMDNGPLSPGRSDNGLPPATYPPVAFNEPPYAVYGQPIAPQPVSYAPGDKSLGHFVTTSRVEATLNGNYPQCGVHAPPRFLRDEIWSGFVYGSSHLMLFPQTVGSFHVKGYVDAATNRLHVTEAPVTSSGATTSWNGAGKIGGAMEVVIGGTFTIAGFIDRDNPQVSGTTRDEGVYRLDPTVHPSVIAGSAGAPVVLEVRAASKPWGDDSDGPNLAELAAVIGNLNRMQAHPTGGNLLIDPVNGGRRPYTVLRCPNSNADLGLYKEDLTLAPIDEGYTAGGVPIVHPVAGGPLWDYGWPMGFEGFHVTGDDGAVYIYVKSMSNSDRPTWFPGFAPLGLPARVFGPFELAGFRRVGASAAVEMTGSSSVIKSAVDQGAATWFWIETAAITQNEGNSGSTAFAVTVRRGGNVSGANTVTATVSGTGISPAIAADFGGTFPSGVLSFAANETTKVFTVNVSGDTTAESDETFKVTLSSPSGGAQIVGSNKGEITCEITNDDAPVASNFVWLVNTLTAPPSLAGSPANATYLRPVDTTFVTREGLKMRSANSGITASNNGGFASVPWWLMSNAFNSAEFELAAGSWEVGFLMSGASPGGTLFMIDNPAGAANVRQSIVLAGASSSISDTDGTVYSNPANAVAGAVNNLTFVPVAISDAGGGQGVLRIYASGGPGTLLSAIALRQA